VDAARVAPKPRLHRRLRPPAEIEIRERGGGRPFQTLVNRRRRSLPASASSSAAAWKLERPELCAATAKNILVRFEKFSPAPVLKGTVAHFSGPRIASRSCLAPTP
jgi:hypothetical protein